MPDGGAWQQEPLKEKEISLVFILWVCYEALLSLKHSSF